MSVFILLGLAMALAMDSFAVSLAIALSLKDPTNRQKFRLASHFGLFQFIMPISGWFAGRGLIEFIQGFDHWVAFGLLLLIGGKMIYEATAIGREDERCESDPTKGLSLITLSLATSMDSLAVGLSLYLIGTGIFYPAFVIGIVTFVFTWLGMRLGPLAGRLFGEWVEIAGGVILILIGCRVLFAHLMG